jgi:integrase/recombinase XerD
MKAGRPKGTGTGKARELTPEEIERLTAATTNPRDRALLWLCIGGGLRVGESCSLTVGRFGSDGSVLIEKSLAKSGRSRRCYVAPRALEYVRAYLATRSDLHPAAPLFPSRSGGGCMTANWGVRLVARLFEAAGIQGATSHSLRRTHANTLNRSGTNILVIQGQLGHRRLNTTAEYLSVSETERSRALSGVHFGL